MSIGNSSPASIRDIFDQDWTITRRIDSGYGFDLLYGHQPRVETGSTWHLILTDTLQRFILEHLQDFVKLDIPISMHRKASLRRMFSSMRYQDLTDWEARRDPDEAVFWVDQDHIELPKLVDINGQEFLPVNVRYFHPDFHIWMGISANPKAGERLNRAYVLTQKLAEFLQDAIDLQAKDLPELGLPLRTETVRQLRARAIAKLKPDMISYKADTAKERALQRTVSSAYLKDAVVKDAIGERFRIGTITETPQGDIILRGRRNRTRNSSGAQVILTHEIAAILDADNSPGSNIRIAERLGVNPVTIKRARQKLGQKRNSNDVWWVPRMSDLLKLQPQPFTEKHGGTYNTNANRRWNARYLLKCARGEGRGRAFLQALASSRNYQDVAREYEFKKPGAISEYRISLRHLKASGLI